jgi:broad specificity phosphatase PhoE
MTMAKTIYLIRHCHTTDNELGINASRTDTALSENGLLEAERLVSQLSMYKFDLIVVSPLKRTIQTIKPFLDTLNGKPTVIVEPLTTERDLGIFTNTKIGDGKILADQAANGKSRTEWKPPGGESCAQVYLRAQQFFDKIRNRPEEHILICGHQNFLRCLELIVLEKPIDDEYFYSPNPARLKNGEIRQYKLDSESNR